MSGDFCIDVNNNVEDLIRSSVDGSLAQELLIYYTTDCDTSNSVTDAIVEAQELVLQIASTTLPSMYEVGTCRENDVKELSSRAM